MVKIEPVGSFRGLDLVFLCVGSDLAKELAPKAVAEGAVVIDNSSAFRLDPSVPLVIPEINAHALNNHQGIIASPNCTTTIMLLPLAPLHRKYQVKRIVAATYQAASGAGQAAMEELRAETEAVLAGRSFERRVMPHPYAFNLFPHNSPLNEHGYAEEELKMVYETRKILDDDSIRVTATCVRVPILRAHSEALNIEFCDAVNLDDARALIASAPGVHFMEDWGNNRFPMPSDATGRDEIYCGRLRLDQSQEKTLEMWVVGDQLLKGAALNCVQIAEKL